MTVSSPTVDMLYVDALRQSIIEGDKDIVLARRYNEGDQDTYLTERMELLFGRHPNSKFRLNVVAQVVAAVKDELTVKGFDTTEKADPANNQKTQSSWAWTLWLKNRMDASQGDVHEAALIDGETFVIVDFDGANGRARFTPNRRYTDLAAGGDGSGCWMVYENDDFHQPALCGVKQWIQTTYDLSGNPIVHLRRTLYFPDRIEKWIEDGGWQHLDKEPFAPIDAPKEPWPIPWVGKDGVPLGIAMIHFRNVGMRPEAWNAIPMQDAINKTLIDVLAADDLTAFMIFAAFGWYPTTDGKPPAEDGSNIMSIGPGQIVGSINPNGKLDSIKGDAATAAAIMDILGGLIMMTAEITGTPASRFTTTKLIAAADTLKGQEEVLRKKAADRKTLFGNSWEDAIVLARKIENSFGTSPTLDETIDFETVWKDSQSLDDILKKQTMGVPEEQLWVEMGYSEEQVNQMRNSSEYLAKQEKMLWEAVRAATSGGCPLELALQRLRVPEKEIALIVTAKAASDKAEQARLATLNNQNLPSDNPNQVGLSKKFVRPGAQLSNPAVIAAGKSTDGGRP